MSVTGKKGVGIPCLLLHDAEGGVVTIELKNGCMYTGTLDESQDNMNCTMKDCTKISSEGVKTHLEVAYVRGSQINYVIVPDQLKKAPFFNRIKMWRKYKGNVVGLGAGTAEFGGPERGAFRGGGRGGGRGVFPDRGRGGGRGSDGGRGDGMGRGGYGGPSGPYNAPGGFQQPPYGGYGYGGGMGGYGGPAQGPPGGMGRGGYGGPQGYPSGGRGPPDMRNSYR